MVLSTHDVAVRLKRAGSELVHRALAAARHLGAIGPDTSRGKRFGAFGERSVICFPPTALVNERYIRIGSHTMIGPYVSLSAGMVPGQRCLTDPVVSIGDRCLIGKGSGIVGHLSIVIEDDVWTGHHVYITDQNHGYRDLERPISVQSMPERPVRIGAGSWLGHGTVVLPGANVGRHVVIGANSVVRGEIPDNCVAAGNPARVIKHLEPGRETRHGTTPSGVREGAVAPSPGGQGELARPAEKSGCGEAAQRSSTERSEAE